MSSTRKLLNLRNKHSSPAPALQGAVCWIRTISSKTRGTVSINNNWSPVNRQFSPGHPLQMAWTFFGILKLLVDLAILTCKAYCGCSNHNLALQVFLSYFFKSFCDSSSLCSEFRFLSSFGFDGMLNVTLGSNTYRTRLRNLFQFVNPFAFRFNVWITLFLFSTRLEFRRRVFQKLFSLRLVTYSILNGINEFRISFSHRISRAANSFISPTGELANSGPMSIFRTK